MKKLLLIALIAFGAPMTAKADSLEKCKIVMNDLTGFYLADAPSIAYEVYSDIIQNQMIAGAKKDRTKAILITFFTHIGGWLLYNSNQGHTIDKSKLDFTEFPDYLCIEKEAQSLFK